MLAVLLPGSLNFLAYQRGRGVQLRVGARHRLPGCPAPGLGRHEPVPVRGARVRRPGRGHRPRWLAPLLTLAALGWLLHWRRRARWRPSTPYDAALTATLLAVVTSRVLSPQYLVWLVALAAVCLAQRETSQRTVALLLLACAALTQLEFPVLWAGVVGARLPADLVLLVRNAGLVCAAVLSARALWRSTVGPESGPDGPPAAGSGWTARDGGTGWSVSGRRRAGGRSAAPLPAEADGAARAGPRRPCSATWSMVAPPGVDEDDGVALVAELERRGRA